LRLSEEWTVYAGMRYNVELDKRISDFIGFGYENECFGLRIHYREAFVKDRDIDPDRSVSLRFELKTIGSAGFSSGIN
jgi:LPS-assembly protein